MIDDQDPTAVTERKALELPWEWCLPWTDELWEKLFQRLRTGSLYFYNIAGLLSPGRMSPGVRVHSSLRLISQVVSFPVVIFKKILVSQLKMAIGLIHTLLYPRCGMFQGWYRPERAPSFSRSVEWKVWKGYLSNADSVLKYLTASTYRAISKSAFFNEQLLFFLWHSLPMLANIPPEGKNRDMMEPTVSPPIFGGKRRNQYLFILKVFYLFLF